MKHYRRIWIENYGTIPKDRNGRTFEIHHVNGNNKDNRLENLMCIPIEEHYKIHLEQKDYAAAFRIAQRMDLDPKVKSKLASLSNKNRLNRGDHPFLDKAVRKKANKSIEENIKNNTQGFQNKDVSRKAVAAKKEKYSSKELSKFAQEGWEMWKMINGDPLGRTLQGSKAGAAKTRGTKWYHKTTGEQLRCSPDDPRVEKEGWIKGRFNGKELSKNANSHKLKYKKSK